MYIERRDTPFPTGGGRIQTGRSRRKAGEVTGAKHAEYACQVCEVSKTLLGFGSNLAKLTTLRLLFGLA